MISLLNILISTALAVEIPVPSRGHATNPIWSHDGKHLAFEANELAGRIDLFTVKVENGQPSGQPKQISVNFSASSFGGPSSVIATGPVWHPQGFLLFEGAYTGTSNRIYINTLTGAPSIQYVRNNQLAGDLTWPTLSPNGEKMVFVSDATGDGDLYVMDLGTQKLDVVLESPHAEMAPQVHSDGSIAYTRKQGGGEDLFVYKNGSSSVRATGNGDQTRPVWSGDSLIYFSNERGTESWDIAITNASGQKKTLIKSVRLPFRASPALSPDGKWVAYGLDSSEGSDRIWFSKLDGSKTVSYDSGLVACGEPALIQSGSRILLAFTALPNEGSDWRKLHVVDVTSTIQ
ncbi:MAG: hypothetical protein VX026_04095 [Myxococcota bacterium]|nr:hypothetical protein [Myxococcota bacterium]